MSKGEKPKLKYVPLNKLELWEEANVRKLDAEEDLDDLIGNIREVGLQNPLVVQYDQDRDKYLIVSGQRRWKALQRLQWKELPCLVTPKTSLIDARIASLSENLYRRSMNPRDISDAVEQLFQRLKDLRKVANKLGVSYQTASKYLQYSKVDTELKRQVDRKNLTVGQAMTIFEKYPDEKQRKAISDKISQIKDRTEKRQLIDAVKIASPKDDFETIKTIAKDKKSMKQYIVHFPPRSSVALEKAAHSVDRDPEDVIVQATEDWLQENKHLA